MFIRVGILLIILTFFLDIIANSQVVNIEKQRTNDQTKKLQGTIDISVNYTKNNTELLQAKNKIQLQYYQNKNSFLLFNELSQVKADQKSYLNDGFLHFRYNYDFKPKFLIGEAFTQYQYNRIKKLKHRYLAGFGPRIRLVDTTNIQSYIGPLLMYEYEILTENSAYTEKLRLSIYASVQFKFNEKLSFNHITYYQPWLKDFSDVRLNSETNLTVSITKNLSYKILFTLAYDTKPPQDVNMLFYTLSNGLSFKF